MAEYQFTVSAREDLINIWLYTQETWGEEQADRYQEQLHGCCQKLAGRKSLGKRASGVNGALVYHCQHHFLFFLRENDDVIILAVLHERMDLIARLRDRL
ncbi:MAG: type II toxin-antitoxin system RelE/ParE family toxin [Roseovarius sp.]|nr:type II toxin-antitoxin system RelE/ParE family toxin [Roseovarius sp.]